MTNFDHPGKKQILIQNAGMDATTQFEDIGHSPKAFKLMPGLQIGVYQPEDDDDLLASKMKGNRVNKADMPLAQRILLGVGAVSVMIFCYWQGTKDFVPYQ